MVPGRPQISLASLEKAFTFDYAYDADGSQREVYDGGVKGMIEKLFSGYNVTVLAYGQTGSGKTHTMGTAYSSDTTDSVMAGIIPRAVQVNDERLFSNIFEATEDRLSRTSFPSVPPAPGSLT